MKYKSALQFLAFIIIGLFSCGEQDVINIEVNLTDLSGNWTADGFECGGVFYNEILDIRHDLETGSVLAFKIQGDPCVPSGDLSFNGTYDGTSTSFKVIVTTGTTSAPSSSRETRDFMEIINWDLMTLRGDRGLIFRR